MCGLLFLRFLCVGPLFALIYLTIFLEMSRLRTEFTIKQGLSALCVEAVYVCVCVRTCVCVKASSCHFM